MKRFVLFIIFLAVAISVSCRQDTSLAQNSFTQATPAAHDKRESVPEPSPQTGPLKLPLKNPSIVVWKGRRILELFSEGKLVRRYRVGLGLSPVEDKVRQGDRRTPEGEFYIFTKNNQSAFYLSLGLSYPNVEDADRGLRDQLISKAQHDAIIRAIKRKSTPPQNTALGGDIYIHGNGSSSDWTWGCVALENDHIRELFDAVPAGTPVTINH